jgi:2,4-dienoyl-CoA reductase-like NADH-dependent reductase (Old Yellow Enzyme family)
MKSLFERAKIGQLAFHNRFIRSAIADRSYDGYIGDALIKNYAGVAAGGVGGIITGTTLVDGEERLLPVAALCSDSFIPGHRKLVDTIHRYDVRIIAQLASVGSYMTESGWPPLVALAPSEVPNVETKTPAREMRLGEIKLLQKKFADAAARAKEAGYDGVEIHSAHGLLLSQFLTPRYNKRTDDYGGSIENRFRMLQETCIAVHRSAGYDFPLWVKLNSTDEMEGGITSDDFLYVCKLLAADGIDAIEVSGARTPSSFRRGAYFKEAAAEAAKEINIPVILTGGNRKANEMTETLNETDVEFLGLARPFLRDPGLVGRFRREISLA